LNISSAFNSVITIYILIPFVIIPQLLFSGVIVKFDSLRSNNPGSYEYVPVIGDIMPSRWSFEALVVDQFKNNSFEKNFFDYDAEMSQSDLYTIFLINNCLKTDLMMCKKYKDSSGHNLEDNFYRLNYYIDWLNNRAGFGEIQGRWKDSLTADLFNASIAVKADRLLNSLADHFKSIRKANSKLKEDARLKIGMEKYNELKEKFENGELNALVLNDRVMQKSIVTGHKIIQKMDPVFMKPISKYGRTQFFASSKQIGNTVFDTFWFNISVLWISVLFLYAALYYNVLQRIITFIGSLRVMPQEK
jgi:hypothetical protein